ncbi:glycosyltransferase [Rivularia sp. PCC 7116]|uniref:glycosyltransferase n=1 Tax=Rivularia sp. PCC 7116 TaxID=373994 RepID=UPI00029EDB4A|nr:glycosyltransferase [Rivularia sp. PCC 7116]AFY53082.1 glycosyltransferase [Rivularia sp. PCC 7116]
MKIAFIVDKFPCLSETFVLNQITGLIDRGHQVKIYAIRPQNESKIHPDIEKYHLLEHTYYAQIPENQLLRAIKGIGLLLTNFHKSPSVLLQTLNFSKYGKEVTSLNLLYTAISVLNHQQSYDIIQCHFGPKGLRGVILRELGIIQGKVVTTFHGTDITTYLEKEGKRAYDLLFSLGDLFLPISYRWKNRLIELGCNGEMTVHRMGIDCTKFSFASRQPRVNGQVEIVTVSRLVEKKGVEYGIRAVAKLLKNQKKNINYTIVGDGPLKESLQELVQQLDVANHVQLLGSKQQQEVIEILKNSHIMLAPSVTSSNGDQEGIPVALMETMAMGLPVVSTFHSGIPELVEDGVAGFLVPERNVDALAEKIGYLVEHPELWSTMGTAGRAFVEEHYNIDKLNDRLVDIFHNAITTNREIALTSV